MITINAAAVRRHCRELGVTLNQLGKESGFSRGYIYRLLAGSDNPTIATVDRLIDAIERIYVEDDRTPPVNLWPDILTRKR